MKQITASLGAATLGIFLLTPLASAQSWKTMPTVRESLNRDHKEIQHHRQELREDLRQGDFAAAQDDKTELEVRQTLRNHREQTLQNYWANHPLAD